MYITHMRIFRCLYLPAYAYSVRRSFRSFNKLVDREELMSKGIRKRGEEEEGRTTTRINGNLINEGNGIDK